MNKKNIIIVILAVLTIAILAGSWWYTNMRPGDRSLADIKDRGVLVVGSDIPFGLMEFYDQDNNPAGIDIDIVREIANRLGLELDVRKYGWDDLFGAVKSGEIDLAISSITITPERQREMLFSIPYFNGGQVILVKSDNQAVKGVIDLLGKKIGVQQDTTGYDEARKYTSDDLIYAYLNFEGVNGGTAIINDLNKGLFSIIIVDYIQALDMITKYSGLKIVGVPFTKEEYGIATKLGNDSLMKKINSTLNDMLEDGTIKKINAKWIKL